MSASAANVFSGLISAITPAIRNSTPNRPYSQPPRSTMAMIMNCWKPEARNIAPTRIPTVVIDAWSNCRITRPITTQKIPNTIHSHHSREKPLIASLACGSTLASIRDPLSITRLASACWQYPAMARRKKRRAPGALRDLLLHRPRGQRAHPAGRAQPGDDPQALAPRQARRRERRGRLAPAHRDAVRAPRRELGDRRAAARRPEDAARPLPDGRLGDPGLGPPDDRPRTSSATSPSSPNEPRPRMGGGRRSADRRALRARPRGDGRRLLALRRRRRGRGALRAGRRAASGRGGDRAGPVLEPRLRPRPDRPPAGQRQRARGPARPPRHRGRP